MSIYPPDEVDIIDLDELERNPRASRRRPRQSAPPPPASSPQGFDDPRLLVPVLLFLLAVLVIFLAWRSNGSAETAPLVTDSELAQSVTNAQFRAGFDSVIVEEIDGVIVLSGEAANATDVAAIGAIARSVEGTGQIDNQITVEGASLDPTFPTTQSALANGGADLETQLNGFGQITFEPGSSDLTGEGTSVIDNVARILEQSPGIRIEIHGHTDSDGDETANQVLSQQRSQAVVSALAQRGIDSGRMTAVGFGESDPIAPNITEDGRATNRRIEFVVP